MAAGQGDHVVVFDLPQDDDDTVLPSDEDELAVYQGRYQDNTSNIDAELLAIAGNVARREASPDPSIHAPSPDPLSEESADDALASDVESEDGIPGDDYHDHARDAVPVGGEENDDGEIAEESENPEFPTRNMTCVSGPVEYDEDFYNGWELLLPPPAPPARSLDEAMETDPPPLVDATPEEPDHPPFLGRRHTTIPGRAPMDFFDGLLRETVWGELAAQTNAYAQRRIAELGADAVARMDHPNYKRHARLNKWKDMTGDEMRVFAAHLIVLGLIKKPELEEYWSGKGLTRTPFFGKYMPRDRFQMILRNFHITDDSNNPRYKQPGHNPLAKLQPFIDLITESFRESYKPGQDISLDEGCCPWKGRLRFRQYNPRKPAKFHIKLFQVCDASTGYVLFFSIFTGKGSCHREGITALSTDSITTKTVCTLLTDAEVLDKGHVIYFDNFFTSYRLLEELLSRGTMACGTARDRQYGPKMLQAKTPKLVLQPGEACALRNGPVLAFKWCQTKPKYVYILTTRHSAIESFSGKFDRSTGQPVYKPKAILDYCNKMGGVDLSDQLMNYYHFLRRSHKWWRKLWGHLFNMVLLNAYVLNKTFGQKRNLTHHEYRYIIAATLMNYTEVPQDMAVVRGRCGGHWPQRLPKSRKTDKVKTRKCKFCFVSAKKAEKTGLVRNEKSTTIICSSCQIPLCIYPCFRLYHTDADRMEQSLTL